MKVLRSGRLSMGRQTERFETAGARIAGVSNGVAVSSGTAALHLAVRVAGVKRGETVVTSSFSFAASTNCFLYEGAVPAFADVDPRTMCIDPESVRNVVRATKRAGGRVTAILAIDVFGQPFGADEIRAIADEEGAVVIEDACEAFGASYRGRPAGSLGHIAAFGFYPNKQITTGEGGLLVTDDDEWARVARSLRNQGRGDGGEWLSHVRLGYNYRLDEMSAALGVIQMRRLGALLRARQRVADLYGRLLGGVTGVGTLGVASSTTRMSWFVYVIVLDAGVDRDGVAARLRARGVETRPYFAPIHTQPYIRELFGDLRGSLPVTESVAARTLALPFHSRISAEGVEYVVDSLKRSLS